MASPENATRATSTLLPLITAAFCFSAGCGPAPKPAEQRKEVKAKADEGDKGADTDGAEEGKKGKKGAKGKKGKKGKKKLARDHTYKGGTEAERERDRSEFSQVDQWTMKLRKKQPIRFLGLPMRQIPTDNWLVSELLYEVKPDYFIEAGTLYGGSAVYYAGMMEFINPDAKILTVDINEEQIHKEAREHPLWKKRVQFFKGSSIAPEIHEQLGKIVKEDDVVFVTLDTLHAPKHVAAELELYSKYVSVGSYMILQDTTYEGLPEVLDEFLAKHPDWKRDTKADKRFGLTKYRGGFLKRVK